MLPWLMTAKIFNFRWHFALVFHGVSRLSTRFLITVCNAKLHSSSRTLYSDSIFVHSKLPHLNRFIQFCNTLCFSRRYDTNLPNYTSCQKIHQRKNKPAGRQGRISTSACYRVLTKRIQSRSYYLATV